MYLHTRNERKGKNKEKEEALVGNKVWGERVAASDDD